MTGVWQLTASVQRSLMRRRHFCAHRAEARPIGFPDPHSPLTPSFWSSPKSLTSYLWPGDALDASILFWVLTPATVFRIIVYSPFYSEYGKQNGTGLSDKRFGAGRSGQGCDSSSASPTPSFLVQPASCPVLSVPRDNARRCSEQRLRHKTSLSGVHANFYLGFY